MKFKHYLAELKRRNVFKAAAAYLVVAWLLVQVLSILLPTFNVSSAILKNTIIGLIIGFPLWLIFSWVFEFTPEGIKKTEDVSSETSINKQTSQNLNRIIIGALSIIIIILVSNMVFKTDIKNTLTPKLEIATEEKDTRNSIAVLPFLNISTEEENAFFTEGMHEDVLNKLAGIKDLKVIARTSVLPYRNFQGNLDSLGNVLGVKYILEGSVRRFENQVKVITSLINANSGETLWTSSYDRTLSNVFVLQSEIAQEITQTLKTELSQSEAENLNQIPTTTIAAYDNFVKARNILNGYYNTQQLQQAIDYLEKAVEFDAEFVEGWELLSTSYSNLFERGLDFEDKIISSVAKGKAENALNKLQQISPESVFYYRAKGNFENIVLNDGIEALKSFDKALELFPNDAKTLFSQAILLSYLNQPRKSISKLEDAYNLDNQNGMVNLYLRMSYQYGRNYEKLIPLINKLYEKFPDRTHYLVQIEYYQFLIDGKLESFNKLQETIENLEITEACNLTVVKDSKMVVAMFNNEFDNYIENWLGTWDAHYVDHGNWSCPAIVNDELNKARLMIDNNKHQDAQSIINKAIANKTQPINEQSVCVFNKSVFEPKLEYFAGNTKEALEKFHKEVPRVMNLNKFPRGPVEREVLLQTADLIAPNEVYSLYKQISAMSYTMVGIETICSNPWTYPNLIKNPEFKKEIIADGRFVEFLKSNNIL